jgi:hypothetical protein
MSISVSTHECINSDTEQVFILENPEKKYISFIMSVNKLKV